MTDFWSPLELDQRCETASACIDTFILFLPLSRFHEAHLQGPHHKTLCRALIAVLFLSPLSFLLKDSASAAVRNISNLENSALWSSFKTLLEWCQLRWVLCFCRGREGRLKLFLYASTSCYLASFFEIRTVASLYNKFTKGILEIDFPHVLFKGTDCANTCVSDWSVQNRYCSRLY